MKYRRSRPSVTKVSEYCRGEIQRTCDFFTRFSYSNNHYVDREWKIEKPTTGVYINIRERLREVDRAKTSARLPGRTSKISVLIPRASSRCEAHVYVSGTFDQVYRSKRRALAFAFARICRRYFTFFRRRRDRHFIV